MNTLMEKSCSFIIDTLYHQSVFCIVLFILIFGVSKIFKGKSPHWQLGLWFLILIRLILPIDLSLSFSARNLMGGFFSSHNVNAPLKKVSDGLALKYQPRQTSVLRIPIQVARQDSLSPVIAEKPYKDEYKKHSWPVKLSIVWFLGVLTFLTLFLNKIRSINRVLNHSSSVRDQQIIAIVSFWRRSFKITRPVNVYSSDKFLSPFTTGLFRPKIFIPEPLLQGMDNETINSIIAHEMVHIKHFDHVWIRFQNVLQIIYFFNPVVWYANRQINMERERICDSKVLTRNVIPPKAFGKSVIDVLKFNLSGYRVVEPLLCFSGHKKIYEYRIRDILNGKTISKRKSLSIFLFVCLLGLFLLPMSNAGIKEKKQKVSERSPSLITEKTRAVIQPDRVVASVRNDGIPVPELIDGKEEVASRKEEIEVKSPKASTEKIKNQEEQLKPASNEKKVNSSENRIEKPKEPIPAQGIETSEPVKQSKKPSVDSFSRGISYLKKGKIEKAISEFSKAIDQDPGEAVSYTARGSAYFRLDQLENALSDYNKAIEINPDFAAAYQNRGSVYYRLGQFDNAISDYNKSIEINPNLVASYQDRGSIYQSRDRFDEAISDYSKALELNPEDPVTYNNRGISYLAKEQYQKALADFNKAIELDPKYAGAYIYRGFYFQARGEYSNAVADYRKALVLDPEMGIAKKMLNEVEQLSDSSESVKGKTDDDQEIECRLVKKRLFSKNKEKDCRTEAEWAKIDKRKAENIKLPLGWQDPPLGWQDPSVQIPPPIPWVQIPP